MPIALLLGGISLITTLIGTGMQVAGAAKSAEASQKAARESAKTERLRRKQMQLESDRQRRGVIRQQLAAQSMAQLARVRNGVDSSSSGVGGATGQINAEARSNLQGIDQAESIGSGIFRSNARIAEYQGMVSFGQGLSQMGGAISGIKFG